MVSDPAASRGRTESLNASRPLRLFIVHSQLLFRQGLRALLSEHPDIDVVADTDSVAGALRVDVTPDVVFAGSILSDALDEEVIVALAARFEAVPVILVGPADRINLVQAAIATGAMGYITMTATIDELVVAVRSVAGGQPFLQPSLGVALTRWHADSSRAAERLTPREREVLRGIALGHTNREIADLLETSLRSVEGRRAGIARKLGFRDRAGLVEYAQQTGLVDLRTSRPATREEEDDSTAPH